jgi:broad specificity phosphatase PhoE
MSSDSTITRLYLARHGATALTAEDRFSGAIGVDLSEEGRRQAALLGSRLATEAPEAVYSSPLSRAVETARFAAAPLGLEPVLVDGLREISHGHWEGLARAEAARRYAEEYAAWEEDPFTFAPEGGESGVAVLARALPAIREIVRQHAGRRVLVVSHKATIRLVLSSLLGIEPRGYRDRLDQAPACLNVLDFRDPVRARLMLFNDTSHYSRAPRLAGPGLSTWWSLERVPPHGSEPAG